MPEKSLEGISFLPTFGVKRTGSRPACLYVEDPGCKLRHSGPKGLNKDCGPLLVSFIFVATSFYGVRMAELKGVKQLARVISGFKSYLFGCAGRHGRVGVS